MEVIDRKGHEEGMDVEQALYKTLEEKDSYPTILPVADLRYKVSICSADHAKCLIKFVG